MRKLFLPLVVLALGAGPLLAAEETWKDVAIVDQHCYKTVKDNPDAHTKECLLKCEKAGYGLFTADKKYLKFDHAGNVKVVEALKASSKTDHIRGTVVGEKKGNTIEVKSVTLD